MRLEEAEELLFIGNRLAFEHPSPGLIEHTSSEREVVGDLGAQDLADPLLSLSMALGQDLRAAVNAQVKVKESGTRRLTSPGRVKSRCGGRAAVPTSKPVTPGQRMEITLDLLPTSWLFCAGHSIRLAIAGVHVDNFVMVPEHGPAPTFTLDHEGEHVAHLDLPVMPRGGVKSG